MRWGVWIGAGCLAVTAAGATVPADPVADARRRLSEARTAQAQAQDRAKTLAAAAAGERDASQKAAREEAVLAARIAAGEAAVATADARVTIATRLLRDQREILAKGEAPAARLTAGLVTLARRPAVATVAQPGSIADLVHLRAALGATLPEVRRRTAAIRAELARTWALEAQAAASARTLAEDRRRLLGERRALASLRERHDAEALRLDRGALDASDRAIALGEAARDLVDRVTEIDDARTTLARLETLPGPPAARTGADPIEPAPYRLPSNGTLVTGLGEVSENGVRSRGLTFAVAPGARVVAPAAGRVLLARRFRSYGVIVIVDHGAGWTTLVTGLGDTSVTRGSMVRAGTPLGRAGGGETPHITVELRRRGRPMDIAALVG